MRRSAWLIPRKVGLGIWLAYFGEAPQRRDWLTGCPRLLLKLGPILQYARIYSSRAVCGYEVEPWLQSALVSVINRTQDCSQYRIV